MRKDGRSHILSVAGAVVMTVAALTACTHPDSNTGISPDAAAPAPTVSPSWQEETSDGVQGDPEAFQQFMIACMAAEGWEVVAAQDGAVSPAEGTYSSEPAFDEALTECIEDAAIPHLE